MEQKDPRERILTRAAETLSVAFHPILAPTLGLLFIITHPYASVFAISGAQKSLLIFLVFLNTALLPALFSYLLVRFGFIASLQMKSVKERRWPYLITAIFYLFTFFLLKEARLPDLIYRLQAGGILTVCMTALISLRWKISAHMAGIGGICALFMLSPIGTGSDGALIATALILLSGLIGSSRIYLKAHHAAQVFAGWLLGFSSVSIFL